MPASLSLVIPCYNEEKRLPSFVQGWELFLQREGPRFFSLFSKVELVFVDDGSSDGSLALIQECAQAVDDGEKIVGRFVQLEVNQGKGGAVQAGAAISSGEWVLITDVDLSTPLEEIFKLYESGADFSFGSRGLKESNIEVSQNGLRPWLGRLFNRFTWLMTGINFKDTQCGFKLVKGDLLRKIAPQLTEQRFAFDIELLLLANARGASASEVAVTWRHDAQSSVSPLKDGIRMGFKVLEFAAKYPRWKSHKASNSSSLRQVA